MTQEEKKNNREWCKLRAQRGVVLCECFCQGGGGGAGNPKKTQQVPFTLTKVRQSPLLTRIFCLPSGAFCDGSKHAAALPVHRQGTQCTAAIFVSIGFLRAHTHTRTHTLTCTQPSLCVGRAQQREVLVEKIVRE